MSVFDTDQLFADQFEPQPDGSYLYRKGSRGAPIPVTAAVALLMTVIVFAGAFVWRGEELPDSWLWAISLIGIAAFSFVWQRLWDAPASALARRPVVGVERSRAEVRAMMTERMGWSQIGFFSLLIPVGLSRAYHAHSEVDWWVWILLSAGLLFAIPVLALRKWRLRRKWPG